LEKQVSKWLTDFVGGCVSEQVRIIFSIPIWTKKCNEVNIKNYQKLSCWH
jgi:valyl-tRNA synthetase